MSGNGGSNLTIWQTLGRTDPAHTKQFKRGGGFKGTAIKPIYTEQKMTEMFGPVGVGWGFSEPQFQIVPGENKEVMVFCWLTLWFLKDGRRSENISGVGGDKIITYIKANDEYKRPERWENDDEAFKKAFTDALGNAMKHLGMSSDVHMGLFDDSKYVREVQAEISAEKRAAVAEQQGESSNTSSPPVKPPVASATVYVTKARDQIRALSTAEAIDRWWREGARDREALGIAKGDTHYRALTDTCADHKQLLARQPQEVAA